jgi:hypothetical protein
MKSYRHTLLTRVPAGQRKTRDLVFFHGVHTLSALIQKLEAPVVPPTPVTPPPAARPAITVTTEGSGESAVFVVRGSAFVPGAAVAIRAARVADGQVFNVFFSTTASPAGQVNPPPGHIELRISIPCLSGLPLSFSANDARPDSSDLTGTLWSNTVTVPCP